MQCLTVLEDGIAVAEMPRTEHSTSDIISLLSVDMDRVLATHLVKKSRNRGLAARYPELSVLAQYEDSVLQLTTNETTLAARLTKDRIRLLDIRDSLKLRDEMKLKGLGVIALSNQTLYAYTNDGILHAFDVSDPSNPSRLWEHQIPKVPQPKGILIDGDRLIINGIRMTEFWTNDEHPAAYYRVGYRWKGLECVIANGDFIYAFNSAAEVSKLMAFRMMRPK